MNRNTRGRLRILRPESAARLAINFFKCDVREAAELAYWFGHRPARIVVRQGRVAFPSPSGRGQGEGTRP